MVFLEDYIHYSLDFLEPNQQWPPEKDANRLLKYTYQREEFELTPEDWVEKMIPDGLLSVIDYGDFISHVRFLGYPRLLTLKTVDMVLGQPPLIAAQGDDALTEKIKEVRNSSKFNATMKQALIDYSRFGVFLLRVFKDEQGRAQIVAWNPREWVPVFYNDGTNRIKHNVIGWRHKDDKLGELLTVQIHNTSDGSYEERTYSIASHIIGRLLKTEKFNTESKKHLFFAVTNTPTTTNPMGASDYEIINGLLQKAIQRLKAILRVLDEHADPSMTGPHSLLQRNEKGEMVFYTSKYYATGKDEEKPSYLTWDGQLDSSFKAFETLCQQIYILSEMGEAFLGAGGGAGNVVSGTAMRFKMISPLEKARRITNEITEPVKEAISSLMAIEGSEVRALDINIAWRDSLPKDPREVAELARLEAGAPAIKPLDKAIMDNYDLDKETADQYVKDIMVFLEMYARHTAKQDSTSSIDETGDGSVDGRSHGPTSSIDIRKKGSPKDPASSENRGEDTGK